MIAASLPAAQSDPSVLYDLDQVNCLQLSRRREDHADTEVETGADSDLIAFDGADPDRALNAMFAIYSCHFPEIESGLFQFLTGLGVDF